MSREPKRSGVVRTGSNRSIANDSDPESTPKTEVSAESKGLSGNIDELVASFLAELNEISPQPASRETPGGSDSGEQTPVPHTAEADEQVVPAQSQAAPQLDLELVATLDELERKQSKPGRSAPSEHQPHPDMTSRPAENTRPATAPRQVRPASSATRQPPPARSPAPAPELITFRPALQRRSQRKRLRTVCWVAATLVLIAGTAITYRVRQPKQLQVSSGAGRTATTVQTPPAAAVQSVSTTPPPKESQASARVQEQEHLKAGTDSAPARHVPESAPVSRRTTTPAAAPSADSSGKRPAEPPVRQAAASAPALAQLSSPAPAAASTIAESGVSVAPVTTSAPAVRPPSNSDNAVQSGAAPPPLADVSAAPTAAAPPPPEKKAAEAEAGPRTSRALSAPESPKPAATAPYKAPTPVTVLRKVVPTYPPMATRLRVWGTVDLDVEVSEKGEVVRAVPISGPALLRSAAADAVSKWQFKPATRNGVDVSSTVKVSVTFEPAKSPEQE